MNNPNPYQTPSLQSLANVRGSDKSVSRTRLYIEETSSGWYVEGMLSFDDVIKLARIAESRLSHTETKSKES